MSRNQPPGGYAKQRQADEARYRWATLKWAREDAIRLHCPSCRAKPHTPCHEQAPEMFCASRFNKALAYYR